MTYILYEPDTGRITSKESSSEKQIKIATSGKLKYIACDRDIDINKYYCPNGILTLREPVIPKQLESRFTNPVIKINQLYDQVNTAQNIQELKIALLEIVTYLPLGSTRIRK